MDNLNVVTRNYVPVANDIHLNILVHRLGNIEEESALVNLTLVNLSKEDFLLGILPISATVSYLLLRVYKIFYQ